MWKHTIPASEAGSRRVAVERDGALLLVSARLRESLAGRLIELGLDDPLDDFDFAIGPGPYVIPEAHSEAHVVRVYRDRHSMTIRARIGTLGRATVIELFLDDPGRAFTFTPERLDPDEPGRWKNIGTCRNFSSTNP